MPYSDPDQQKEVMRKIMQDYRKRKKLEREKNKIQIQRLQDELQKKKKELEWANSYVNPLSNAHTMDFIDTNVERVPFPKIKMGKSENDKK